MVAYFYRSLRDRSPGSTSSSGSSWAGRSATSPSGSDRATSPTGSPGGIGDTRWPTFNVADSSVVVGIGILVVYLFLTSPDRREATA
jgi:lipoprotein signal peptidase